MAMLIVDSIEYSINLREKYGLYSGANAEEFRSSFVKASREILKFSDQVMSLYDGRDNCKDAK